MLTYKPMLAGTAETVPASDWLHEPKLDGWRTMIVNSMSGLRLYSGRNGAEYTGRVPLIERGLHPVLPPGCVIDGELFGAGGIGDAQSAMSSHAGDAGAHLTYVVFDILRVDDQFDVTAQPLTVRRELLERIEWPEHVSLVPQGQARQETHDQFLALGLEGSMFKRPEGRYVQGRSKLWLKLKAAFSDEARVVGFKPGKVGSDLEGMVGAFMVEMLADGAKTTVKCGAAKLHEEATVHPERWLGKVIEVKHNGLGKTGKPRHPSFLRARPDRDAA